MKLKHLFNQLLIVLSTPLPCGVTGLEGEVVSGVETETAAVVVVVVPGILDTETGATVVVAEVGTADDGGRLKPVSVPVPVIPAPHLSLPLLVLVSTNSPPGIEVI